MTKETINDGQFQFSARERHKFKSRRSVVSFVCFISFHFLPLETGHLLCASPHAQAHDLRNVKWQQRFAKVNLRKATFGWCSKKAQLKISHTNDDKNGHEKWP